MPEDFRPDRIRAIFDANSKIENFPKEKFYEIVLAPGEDLHPQLEAFIQRPDASFMLRQGDFCAISGRTPEIQKAIEEQFNLRGNPL